jgi:hypothetical protein
MAVITAKSWVLGGISVLNDGKAGWVRLGSLYQGQVQAPPIPFSMRHPSMGCRVRFTEPVQRQDHVDNSDVGHAAPRAGRLVSLAGVLLQSPRLAASACWPAASKRKRLSRCYRTSKRTTARTAHRTLIRGF